MANNSDQNGNVKHWGDQVASLRVNGGGPLELDMQSATLPCLFSNNSIDPSKTTDKTPQNDERAADLVLALSTVLTPYHKRVAHTLYANVSRLIEKAPTPGHVGFLTITFPDNVTDHREAYKRFRSFNSNFLAPHPDISDWICVKERQKRGSWHYHLLVTLTQDIRTGVDFDQFAAGDYSTASAFLRDLWTQFRTRLPEYQMGRSELLPIRSNAEAMGRYVGKYISKHVGARDEQDKGVRLVNYSRGWTRNSLRFSWNTKNAAAWRRKLGLFAQYMGCTEMYQLTDRLGSGWAFKHAQDIIDIEYALVEDLGQMQPEHQDETLTRITERRLAREVSMREDLVLISKKTDSQKRKEEARARIARIVQDGITITDEQVAAAQAALEERKKEVIDNHSLCREWHSKFDRQQEKDSDIEGVPF